MKGYYCNNMDEINWGGWKNPWAYGTVNKINKLRQKKLGPSYTSMLSFLIYVCYSVDPLNLSTNWVANWESDIHKNHSMFLHSLNLFFCLKMNMKGHRIILLFKIRRKLRDEQVPFWSNYFWNNVGLGNWTRLCLRASPYSGTCSWKRSFSCGDKGNSAFGMLPQGRCSQVPSPAVIPRPLFSDLCNSVPWEHSDGHLMRCHEILHSKERSMLAHLFL